jgi:hypothetical protein
MAGQAAQAGRDAETEGLIHGACGIAGRSGGQRYNSENHGGLRVDSSLTIRRLSLVIRDITFRTNVVSCREIERDLLATAPAGL